MSRNDEAARVVAFWLEKADAALASARAERTAGRIDFAVNRAYYAAFYAASAALLGRAFDRLFESRQRADYLAFGEFEAAEVDKLIAGS